VPEDLTGISVSASGFLGAFLGALTALTRGRSGSRVVAPGFRVILVGMAAFHHAALAKAEWGGDAASFVSSGYRTRPLRSWLLMPQHLEAPFDSALFQQPFALAYGLHTMPTLSATKNLSATKEICNRPTLADLKLRPRCWALSICLAWAASLGGLAAAAPPLGAAQQSRLDAAVLVYEAGERVKAQRAFEALEREGVPAAAYNLAVMHLSGEAAPASPAKARQLLTRAAQGGFVTAQFMLAQALETGQLGGRELALAHQWYEVAALSGSVEAKLAMGTAFYLGRGRPKDPARAVHWFREAAKGGDIGAMYLLASMYEQGDGVEADLRLARYWYAVAASQGDDAAPGKVKEMDAKMAAPSGAATARP